jgi:hypothetical protein
MSHTNDGIKRPENWQCMYNLSALNLRDYYILRKVESLRREILQQQHEHPDVIDIQFDSDPFISIVERGRERPASTGRCIALTDTNKALAHTQSEGKKLR